ncbi:LysR family transcriptional regulator [Marinomonas sp. 2405UD68-3]|uniref:LysR family transcriptional regulator n=1 Tax=Marinomonas sp. 2405UD68-3 TaxID=3391835 RepID=UPI0039C96C35
MQKTARVTLEQWRVLLAVVDCGGFSQAAEALHKSQSSVSYTVAKLQEQLGYPLLVIEGRKAQLTDQGHVLIKRSRQLLEEAIELETLAHTLRTGWETEIEVIIDGAFPTIPLLKALQVFQLQSRGTLIRLRDSTQSLEEIPLEEAPDLLICPDIPNGFSASLIVETDILAVASPCHSLFYQTESISVEHLSNELHIIAANTAGNSEHSHNATSAFSWTVPNVQSVIEIVSKGMGFAWLPISEIAIRLEQGELKALPLLSGNRQSIRFFSIFGKKDKTGPATQLFLDILKNECALMNIKCL